MADFGDGTTYLSRRCTFVKCVAGMLNTLLGVLSEYDVPYRLGAGVELGEPQYVCVNWRRRCSVA